MCILEASFIRARAEPEGYNLSYSIPLKKFFLVSIYAKNPCSEPLRFKVGSSLSFPNLEVSERISSIALL